MVTYEIQMEHSRKPFFILEIRRMSTGWMALKQDELEWFVMK